MTDFRDNQQQTLSSEDRAFLDRLDQERGVLEQVGATFHGPLRYWTAYAVFVSLVLFGAAVYAFVQLFSVSTIAMAGVWLAVFLWTSMGVGLIKLWFWMRMNHLQTLRGIKRLELRLVERG
jgi:hypothetical protein